MFACKIHRSMVDTFILLCAFPLHMPARRGRKNQVLNIPFAGVNIVKESLFGRVPRVVTEFLSRSPGTEMFHQTYGEFKSSVTRYV